MSYQIVDAQVSKTKWDDSSDHEWPEIFRVANIKSTADAKIQNAYYYFPDNGKDPRPLIVSLHTWSGDYTQKDPLASIVANKGWNYIHPNFRGVNNKPEACGSKYVISDIDDAITFAMRNSNTDSSNIHIIGASGGGFATMLAYMKSKHNVRTFSSWVGISDLTKWYFESLGRNNKYAKHIRLVTTGDTISVDLEEAKKRSPFYMSTPVEQRHNSKLYLYCGIHDGYTGSVPITQTIDFYNKLVTDLDPNAKSELVTSEEREIMLRQRNIQDLDFDEQLGDRKLWYKNSCLNHVFLKVFEGGHEMIVDDALVEIEKTSR